ncbi:uncharacterized protein LOC109831336 [Asparagus officinalis]|uniref:uncharacterized protein LOC109831336 n=1 Tax=Asparagus officinalis TaxID=4686 RepID=UPI00098E27A3|nr:uncharacterized protein LOC109831336 [Asparagus officinalis]
MVAKRLTSSDHRRRRPSTLRPPPPPTKHPPTTAAADQAPSDHRRRRPSTLRPPPPPTKFAPTAAADQASMANSIPIICFFNGSLGVGLNSMPMYEGGSRKMFMISKSLNFDGMMNEIHRVTKINKAWYAIKVFFNCPINESRTIAVAITDDEELNDMKQLVEKQVSVELFIEKYPIQEFSQVSRSQGEFSRMMDLDNESSGFMTSPSQEPWCQLQHLSGHSLGGTSSTIFNDASGYVTGDLPARMNEVEHANEQDERNRKCPWLLNAAVRKSTNGQFVISRYCGLHTCCNPSVDVDHYSASSSYICKLIMPEVRAELDLNASQIFQRYLEAIKRNNPGTEYEILSEEIAPGMERFTRVFWAFGPAIKGFTFCRPLLSIDGTHLYGKYKGVLLVATGVDANGGLFPLAFAVVEVEDTSSWKWFFELIYKWIPSVRAPRLITFISDRMKGIIRALHEGFGAPHHHRYCLRHIRDNFKKKHGEINLQNLLWQAGCATDTLVYEHCREKIKSLSLDAHNWIEHNLKPQFKHRWALCKDEGVRFCMMTTNCSGSFNGVLKGARAMPIQSLVARTFYRLNSYFNKRYRIMTVSTPLNCLMLIALAHVTYHNFKKYLVHMFLRLPPISRVVREFHIIGIVHHGIQQFITERHTVRVFIHPTGL